MKPLDIDNEIVKAAHQIAQDVDLRVPDYIVREINRVQKPAKQSKRRKLRIKRAMNKIDGNDIIRRRKIVENATIYVRNAAQIYLNMEFNAADDPQVKRIMKFDNKSISDCEPIQRAMDPRKRRSWSEFCADFVGQNYGAIAQDLLELHNSDDRADHIQFIKFCESMGKTSDPPQTRVNINAEINQTDIYAQLIQMTAINGELPQDDDMQDQDELDEPKPKRQYNKKQDLLDEFTSIEECDSISQTEQEPVAAMDQSKQQDDVSEIIYEDTK